MMQRPHRRRKRASLGMIALALVASCAPLCSQQTPWVWGVWASGSLAIPATDVREIPGAPSCLAIDARLDDNSGHAIGFGGEIARTIATDMQVSARLGVSVATARFAARESIGAISVGGGALAEGIVEYQSDVDVFSITIEPAVRWQPKPPLTLAVGAQLMVPVRAVLDHREMLVAPAQAVYIDGTTERALAHGSLGEYAQPWVGITASAGFDIRIAATTTLRPEIGGVLALTSPLRDVDWHPHEIRAGISLMFGDIGESTPIVPYDR